MVTVVAKGIECRLDRPVNPPEVPGDDSIGALQSLPEGSNPRPFGPVGFDPLGPVGFDFHPLEPVDRSEVPIEQRDGVRQLARADILGSDSRPRRIDRM